MTRLPRQTSSERTSRGTVPWFGAFPTSNPMAISFMVLCAALIVAATSVDASPRLISSSISKLRGSFQPGLSGGDQKGQRTTRGFKNHELSVARGFGKRSGGEEAVVGVEEGPPKGHPARLRWLGFGGAAGNGRGEEGEMEDVEGGEELRKDMNPFPLQFGPGSRFPVQWLAEEVAGNPGLAQILVRRFVDEDGDGEVTAEEMLRPFAS